jgi:NTE family protein
MLYKISLASSAIPGLFPPMMWQDMLLVDGGALKPLPTEALKEIGKYFIMAVNTENLNYQFTAPKNALDIVFLVDKMRYNHVLSENSQEADLLISPDLSGFTWTDFDCAEKIIAMGEKIILDNAEKLTRLNKINTGKSLKHKVFHFFNSLRSYKKA